MNQSPQPHAPQADATDDATLAPEAARQTLPEPLADATAPTLMSAADRADDLASHPADLDAASAQTLDSGQHPKAPRLSGASGHSHGEGSGGAAALLLVDATYYERGEELARGGMGRILLARDRRLQRPVAIKELLTPSDRARRRFEREALITARLQHPSIVNVYEAGCWPSGEPFYAMEKVNGRPLEDVIEAAPTLKARLGLLPQLIGVADAMAYAHSQRVIHRDLKPANVLVGAFGEAIVIDWGLAKVIDEPDEAAPDVVPSVDARDNLTVAGAVMGTPAFMPPEQAHGLPVDARADVYALGAMLYHLLAGEPPFKGKTSRQILISLVGQELPVPLAALCPDAPPELVSVIARAMHPDPDARYPDAGALAADLRDFQTGRVVASHQYSAAEVLRRWWRRHKPLILLTCACALALAVLAAYSVRQVMRARDTAQAERDLADARRLDALSARAFAESLSNDAVIAQARALLDRDPTAALAWLKRLNPDAPTGWPQARALTADVTARGVAEHVLRGHRGLIARLVLTPGDRALLSSASDGTLRRWHLSDRSAVTFSHPQGLDPHFALSSDARWAATLTLRGRVALLDLRAPASAAPAAAPAASAASVALIAPDTLTDALPLLAFSPSAPSLLALATASQGLHLYDADAAALWPVALPGLPQGVALDALRFRPSGDLTASGAGMTWRVDPTTRAAERLPDLPAAGPTADLLYAPNDAWALQRAADRPPALLRCDVRACAPGPRLDIPDAPDAPAAAAHFSPDSRWLALSYAPTPTARATLRLFDLSALASDAARVAPALTLTSDADAADAFRHLRFDPAARMLAATSAAGVEVFDLSRPAGYARALRLPDALSATFSTASAGTSPRLLTAHLDQTIRIHRLSSASLPALTAPPVGFQGPARAAVLDPRGGVTLLDAGGTVWGQGGARLDAPTAAARPSALLTDPADGGPLLATLDPDTRALTLAPLRDPAASVRLSGPALAFGAGFGMAGYGSSGKGDDGDTDGDKGSPPDEDERRVAAQADDNPPTRDGARAEPLAAAAVAEAAATRPDPPRPDPASAPQVVAAVSPLPKPIEPSQDADDAPKRAAPKPQATSGSFGGLSSDAGFGGGVSGGGGVISGLGISGNGPGGGGGGNGPGGGIGSAGITDKKQDQGLAQASAKATDGVGPDPDAQAQAKAKPSAPAKAEAPASALTSGALGGPPAFAAGMPAMVEVPPPTDLATARAADLAATEGATRGVDPDAPNEDTTAHAAAAAADAPAAAAPAAAAPADAADAYGDLVGAALPLGDARPQAPQPPPDPARVLSDDLTSNPASARQVLHPDLSRDPLATQAALLTFSPQHASALFTASDDLRALWRWDTADPTAPPRVIPLPALPDATATTTPADAITQSLAIAPDGALFLSAGLGHLLHLGPDLAPLPPLASDGLTPLRLTPSPDATRLAAVVAPGHIRLWHLPSQTHLDLYTDRRDALPLLLSFSPDGASFAAADDAHTLHLWHLPTTPSTSTTSTTSTTSPPTQATYRAWDAHPAPILALGWLPPPTDPDAPPALTSVAADGYTARWPSAPPADPAALRALWDTLSPVTLGPDLLPSTSR